MFVLWDVRIFCTLRSILGLIIGNHIFDMINLHFAADTISRNIDTVGEPRFCFGDVRSELRPKELQF